MFTNSVNHNKKEWINSKFMYLIENAFSTIFRLTTFGWHRENEKYFFIAYIFFGASSFVYKFFVLLTTPIFFVWISSNHLPNLRIYISFCLACYYRFIFIIFISLKCKNRHHHHRHWAGEWEKVAKSFKFIFFHLYKGQFIFIYIKYMLLLFLIYSGFSAFYLQRWFSSIGW